MRVRARTLTAVGLIVLTGCSGSSEPSGAEDGSVDPTAAPPAASSAVPRSVGSAPGTSARPAVVAESLEVPWGLDFLPDGSALATLRDRGEVVRLRPGASPESLGTVPGVVADGEGGLLGLAVSPRFDTDHRVFVYLTADEDNRVLRMTLHDGRLLADRVIVSGIPKASVHNGGRIAFGPDGDLYIGTGDGGDGSHSQDRESLGGKILRVDQDGHAPAGNPFGDSPVWTMGHRNVQGLAWDAQDRMYASEFGQDTWDELNRIEPGKNYGWPKVEGRAGRPGSVDPLVQWPTSEASPSGIAVGRDHAVYLAALRGESLWRIPLDDNGDTETPERLLEGTYGRLRTVVRGPDGQLWLVTSNTFRGEPRPGDDRVLILPEGFPVGP